MGPPRNLYISSLLLIFFLFKGSFFTIIIISAVHSWIRRYKDFLTFFFSLSSALLLLLCVKPNNYLGRWRNEHLLVSSFFVRTQKGSHDSLLLISLYLFNFPCYSPTHKNWSTTKKSSPLPTIATRRKTDDDDDDDVEEGFTWKGWIVIINSVSGFYIDHTYIIYICRA